MELFLVCTESSGDLLGARLVRELKKTQPELRFVGVGGEKLLEEGMERRFTVSDFNVMGLFEVLSQLKRLRAMFQILVEDVVRRRPAAVLLIDAPDFNLRFAKALRERDIQVPLIYYVSPQVWAWREKRAVEIARLVDHMMVLFAFEVPIYEKLGLPVTWVGHPLVDEVTAEGDRQTYLEARGLRTDLPLVALAPGSRRSEVRRLLPILAQVASTRKERYQFAIPLASTISLDEARSLLAGVDVPILPGEMRLLMRHADAAIVASGTATLETALLQTPMLVGYRMKVMSYFLAKRLVKVKNVALVNIVLGRSLVPELIQDNFCVEKLVPLLDEITGDGPLREEMITAFSGLAQTLGGGGAAKRAAQVVESYILKVGTANETKK